MLICGFLIRYSGPEIEGWFGVEDGEGKGGVDLAVENDWGFLPFMALADGAHTYEHILYPFLPFLPPFSIPSLFSSLLSSPRDTEAYAFPR